MIPIIVSTYPENGSTDAELNSPITITFADSIDASSITVDRIKLENKNEGRYIPLAFTYNQETFELTITPSDDQYGNMLLGLTKYKLSMANISSNQAELMHGLHTMEFFTVSDSPEDITEDPTVVTEEFAIINFYPKQGSYGVSPNVIKIKCNKNVLVSSINSDTFMVTSDTVEDINDIGFVDISTITGEYEISNDVISFKPYTEYEESLGSGLLLTDETLRKSFQLTNYPVYQAVISVDDIEVTVDVDYTIDMTTGAISFIDGYEPAEDEEVTATTRKSLTLSDNTKYTIVLSGIQSLTVDPLEAETIQPTMYSFYSKFSPLYATLADIQTTYASVAMVIQNSDPVGILEIIRANSEMAKWIAVSNSNDSNINWNTPDKIVLEYVKSKTRYDLIFDRYLQESNEASSKTLGDLEVSYDKSIVDLLKLADKMKVTYEYWENMLKGSTSGRSRPQPFVKGENIDAVPDYKDRSLKDWTGTKSW